jgi:tRNA1Val (adenine37-N6)-methyltransferase
MGNPFFQFKKFTVYHDQSAMKVTTDACLLGAWCASQIQNHQPQKQKLLDIGAGTGLLSLMVAQKNNLGIDAIEIEALAAGQAVNNVASSPFKEQVNVVQQDICHFEKEGYDYIISNPPFYENELQSPSKLKNAAHHSGELKWQQLFSIINKKLTATGRFYLLLPYKRINEIEGLLQNENLHANEMVIVRQSVLHAPFRILLQGSKQKTELVTSSLAITDEQKKYTTHFIELLKDYYLYL